MRIAQVVTLVSPDGAYGGPVRVAVNQLKELQRRGHEVCIYAAARGFDELPTELDGVPLRAFPARRLIPRTGFAGLTAPRLLLALRRDVKRYDVVHVHLARDLVTLPAAQIVLAQGIPLYLQTHGMIDSSQHPLAEPLDRMLTRQVLRGAQCVFYLTERERLDLLEVSRGEATIRRLVNGVPTPPPQLETRESRPVEVLYLARLHRRKRPLAFLDAAERLTKQFPCARFTLVGPDEAEGPAVARRIQRLSNPQITWEGALAPEDTLRRMASCAIYVLPSVDEPFPMSVLEAASLGKSVVVTDTCGLAPYIERYGAGRVADASKESLIGALRDLLTNEKARKEAGTGARRMVDAEFRQSTVADQLEASYSAALVGGPRAPRVLFLTNTSTPYREPVWEHLGTLCSLTVGLFEPVLTPHEECPPERAADWAAGTNDSASFRTIALPTIRVVRGASALYTLKRPVRHMLKNFDAVILGGWESPAYHQVALDCHLLGIPVLGFYESTLLTSRYQDGIAAVVRSRFLQSLSGIVVPGVAAERSVRAKGVRRVWRGFNPVDGESFALANSAVPRGDRPMRFLFVGVLAHRKNVDGLLRAFAQGSQDWCLGIVGSGPEEDSVRALALELGIDDRIQWHGYVPNSELPEVMRRYDCLVLVPHVEVWGLVVNEALAAGMNVVVSKNCGVAESVQGMPGVYLTDQSTSKIAAAMAAADAAFQGRVHNPPILRHSPSAFAEVFYQAIAEVLV